MYKVQNIEKDIRFIRKTHRAPVRNLLLSFGTIVIVIAQILLALFIGNYDKPYYGYHKGFCYDISANGVIIRDCNLKGDVKIPEQIEGKTVVEIGISAFSHCKKLTGITIPDTVTEIGDNAFTGCPIKLARIPAFAAKYIPKSSLQSVEITSGESIERSAFEDCIKLTNVVLPEGLTSIGVSAFKHCYELTNITIPDSVTSIGDSAFLSCISLTSIKIPNGVTTIDFDTFCGCKKLANIGIPDGMRCIWHSAFQGCSELTSIVIPESVDNMGGNVFIGCNELTIYCRANGKPMKWDNDWDLTSNSWSLDGGYNYKHAKVVWGYKE